MKGIEKIKEYFAEFPENYIVIGGTAYNIIVSDMSFNERSTKDVDMILVEAEMNKAFMDRFWAFIKDGGYSAGTKKTDEGVKKNIFYRFVSPGDEEFPQQIELCSRKPDDIELPPEIRIVHIENEGSLSNFSAIILDDDYYNFAVSHTRGEDGITIVDEYALIVLKMKAYLNNRKKKEEGERLDQENITKHKNDIYRRVFTFKDDASVMITDSIKEDFRKFLQAIETDSIDTKNLSKAMGVAELAIDDFKEIIIKTFKL